MGKKIVMLSIIVFLLVFSSCVYARAPHKSHQEFVPGEVIIKYKEPKQKNNEEVSFGVHSISKPDKKDNNQPKIHKIKLNKNSNVVKAALTYSNYPGIEYAEPNYIFEANSITPNDANYSLQWALAQINATLAWDIERGDSNIIIAIIDTGVDWDHPDLAANIWNNTDEVEDGNDTDANGYIDDIRGWDFVNASSGCAAEDDCLSRDNDPMDYQGHGTHCSGISAAVTNNSLGIAGICWNCKIMPVRAGYESTSGNGVLRSTDAADAITYAADNGADVISMSWGGTGISTPIRNAIDYAHSKGVVLVAAAGNVISSNKEYPAGFDNVIAVGASDKNHVKASYSRFGSWIDVGAPGGNSPSGDPADSVFSTMFNDTYTSLYGTSMATPYVAGILGLVLSKNSTFTQAQVKSIAHTAVDDNLLESVYFGTGIISAYDALQIDDIPVAELNSSLDMISFSSSITINGTANGTSFANYSLYYGYDESYLAYPSSWTLFNYSTVEVNNGVLTSWDASSLSNRDYIIKLVVTDTAGQESIDKVYVTKNNLCAHTTIWSEDYVLELGDNISATACNGINIFANNVTIDCNGNYIIGDGTSSVDGIYVNGFNRTTIRNCVLTNHNNYGEISISNSYNNTVINNTFPDSGIDCIYFDKVNDSFIINNTFYNVYEAMFLTGSSNNVISGNNIINVTVGDFGDGIYLAGEIGYDSAYNNITENNINTTEDYDIWLSDLGVKYNNIWNNNFYGTGIEDSGANNIYCIGGSGNYYDSGINLANVINGTCGVLSLPYPNSAFSSLSMTDNDGNSFNLTDDSGNTINPSGIDKNITIQDSTGKKLVQVEGQFSNGAVDLSNLQIEYNDVTVVVDFSSVSTNIASTHTLFYPNTGTGFLLCPEAKTIVQATSDCANATLFTHYDAENNISKSIAGSYDVTATIDGNYYKIMGLTGTAITWAQNVSVISRVSILNTPPTVDSVTLSDSDGGDMDLYPNSTVTINCSGTASDTDGWSTISINATLNTTIAAGSSDNLLNHYSNTSCVTSQNTATQANYECTFSVWYNAIPGTWTCTATATDGTLTDSNTDVETMGQLMAIDIDEGDIDFGALAVGASTTDSSLDHSNNKTIYNQGNVIFDVNLKAYGDSGIGDNNSMSCDSGNITISMLKYTFNTTSEAHNWSLMTSMQNGSGTDYNISVPVSQDTSGTPTNPSNSSWWAYKIPTEPIVSGDCSGTLMFSAISDT